MKKVLVVICALALLGGGGWYLYRTKGKEAVRYRTATVERGEISETVTATGTINPVSTVQVGSQVSGTIKEIRADFNSTVKKGEVIARIDPLRFQAAVDQARASLASARAGLEKAEATLVDAERTLSRSKGLLSDGFIARSEVDSAQTARDLAVAQRKVAAAAVSQAQASLRQAETDLGYTSILSPVNGTVISRSVDVGQTVAASFQTPTLFSIAQDLSRMQIDTSVDESDIARVTTGLPVSFTVDAYPGRTFEGSVEQVRNAPIVSQNVVTYNVVVRVDNRELLLKPGMTANASIRIRTLRDVVKIPNGALRYRPKDVPAEEGKRKGKDNASAAAAPADKGAAGKGGAPSRPGAASPPGKVVQEGTAGTVWLPVAEGKPRPVQVRTGITDGTFTVQLSGPLADGQEVVTGEAPTKKSNGSGAPPGMGMGRPH
jgi:HlyD family secretion protein